MHRGGHSSSHPHVVGDGEGMNERGIKQRNATLVNIIMCSFTTRKQDVGTWCEGDKCPEENIVPGEKSGPQCLEKRV